MTTPTLNGQIIGQAERTTRAVLDRLLSETGTTFEQWVAINLTATGVPGVADRLVAGLRLSPEAARSVVTELTDLGLLTQGLDLTSAGRERYAEISAGIAEITERLYGGLPADDLATAGRVLTEITSRAQAELT